MTDQSLVRPSVSAPGSSRDDDGARAAREIVVDLRGADHGAIAALHRSIAELPECAFIVVASGMSDTDYDALAASLAASSNVRLVRMLAAFGLGAAWRTGVGLCSAPAVGFLTLQDEVGPAAIRALFDALEADERCDCIVGNRWASREGDRSVRRFMSGANALMTRILLGLRVRDVQSPFKVFRGARVREIFERLRLFDAGFHAELLYRVHKMGGRIRELPMPWRERRYDGVDAGGALRTFAALLVVRLSNSLMIEQSPLNLLGRHFIIPAKRRYNILLFAWRDPLHPSAGGGEVYLHEQARCWIESGHRVTWVAQSFRGGPRREVVDGIEVLRVAPFPFVFVAGALWYLTRSRRDYDFVVDCMNGIPFFTPLFSTKPKVCLIYHIHARHFREELPRPLADFATFVEAKVVPFVYRGTRFLTISDSTKRQMEALGMSSFPIELIHSGISPALVPGAKAAVPTILYLGRIRRYKRIRKLIASFEEVRKRLPDARLIVAGTGDDLDALRGLVRERGIAGIEFRGRVDDDEKVRLMQEAWVLGMPSSVEGWGIVVIEANACATPAVAYRVPGLQDCIVDGTTGTLARSDEEFTAGLLALLEDAELRERTSREALAWSRHFSWQKTAELTLQRIRASQPWRGVFEHDRLTWRLVAGGWKGEPHAPRTVRRAEPNVPLAG